MSWVLIILLSRCLRSFAVRNKQPRLMSYHSKMSGPAPGIHKSR